MDSINILKNDPTISCVQKHISSKNKNNLNIKGPKEIYYTNNKQKIAAKA